MNLKVLLGVMIGVSLWTGCQHGEKSIDLELPDAEWQDAQWIGYEELADSMKIIPGVHGSGDHLGELGMKRPVVPQLRKEISVRKKIEEAVLYVSGLGHYTFRLDGEALDDRFLAPGWTLYSKTCYYNTYDLTDYLKKGEHVLGFTVGNGFFNVNRERYRKLVTAWGNPMLRAKLLIKYRDGSEEQLVTNAQWKVSPSPTVYTSIYGGEDYDARLVQDGWMQPGFDDSGWQDAVVVPGPGGEMKAETDYPLKVMQTFEPASITLLENGNYLYDFGQNASGIPELSVRGSEGQTLRLIPGELIDDQGAVTQQASGGPCYFDYTLAGDENENWRPSFTYYGFRYLEVAGAVPVGTANPENLPVLDQLLFHHTRNSAPTTGTFQCSNELFNDIYDLIDWSVRSNLASVTTDCPHREKLGWLEVPHLMGNSLHYLYDIRPLYNKMVDDMIDSQLDNGLVPDIAPEYVPFAGGFRDSPEWGSSAVIIPWLLYEWYGDREAMTRAWPMMERYMAYLKSRSVEHILSHGLGDWFDLGQQSPGSSQLTPLALTATAIWYYDLTLMEKMAMILDKKEEQTLYHNQANQVRMAFLERFYDQETRVIATGSQTAYAMPLVVGLIDEKDHSAVMQNLLKSIEDDGFALTAGDVGFHYLVSALSSSGEHEVIFKMNARDDVPGYGYQLKKGATALTESWPALRYVSNNHMMLGHLMEWFYNGIGGIRQAPGSIAYDKIIIDPYAPGDLTWADVTYQSIKGEIAVHWKIVNQNAHLEFTIPKGSQAEVSFNGQKIGTFNPGSHKQTIPLIK